jgi:hypothetical protein
VVRLPAVPSEQVNAILLIAFGLLMVLVNKPFAVICRAWDKMIFGRDLGLGPFRLPILGIGVLLQVMGLLFLLF